MIKKRRIEQMKATEINKLKQAEAQRFKDEDERRREIERYVIAYETIKRTSIQQCHISLATMADCYLLPKYCVRTSAPPDIE
jgi:predicted transcriptional regulator of viral defense system